MSSEFDYTMHVRRALGIPSPMNVWKKQFTQLSHWQVLAIEMQREYEFLKGDRWPVGSTVRIKTPQRYQVNGPAN